MQAHRAADGARESRRGAEAALEKVRGDVRQLRAEKAAIEARMRQMEQQVSNEGPSPRNLAGGKPPLSPAPMPMPPRGALSVPKEAEAGALIATLAAAAEEVVTM